MATPYRISIGVDIDASGAKRGSAETRQEVSAIAAEAEKATPKIEAVANAVQKLDSAASSGAAVASIDAIRASAVGAIPSMERLVNTFAGIAAPAANDNGRVATLAAYAAELDRMQAKFDPVFAAQQRYEQNLSQINELERVGAITASAAIEARLREANAYDGLISKVERLAAARKAAAQEVVDRQTITPDRAADVEAYGRSLDQLRARYNPLYATVVQYKQAQVEIRNAHAVGAISADEMTEALSRQRQATLRSIDVIKGRNKALADTPAIDSGRGFQTANLAAQFQDIGVTAAMGMSPLQIALQQGTQLSAVLSTMDRPVMGLAAAFASVLSPLSLVTIGVVAAGAAAIQYFGSIMSDGEKSAEILREQADLIDRAARTWGDAVPALQQYIDQLERAREQSELLQASDAIADQKWAKARADIVDVNVELANAVDLLITAGGQDENIRKLQRAFNEVADGVEKGKQNTVAMKDAQDALTSAINGTGITALSDLKITFQGLAETIAGAARQANAFREQAVQALVSGKTLGEFKPLSPLFSEDGKLVSGEDFTPRNPPTPSRRPLIELEGLPGSEKLARGAASARNAYRDLIKSADDRIAQMKLEAEMAGKVGIEADALRFQLDLLQRSEDKGRSISEKQREEINKKVEAFKAYAEAAATAKLRADLLWESEQAGRSWMEQQIAARQRSAGLDVDFDSVEADLIRMNLALEVSKSYAADFSDTLFDGLAKGEDLFDSLADAGISALKRLGKSLWDDVLNMLFSAQGTSGGGWLSGILSLFGGGTAAADPWSGLRTVTETGASAAISAASSTMRAATVQPMLPASRSVDQVAQASAGAISRLKIELGLAADSDLNIRPQVVGVVQETAPEIAIDLIEQNNDGEAARVAQHNRNPRWR